MAFLCYLLNDEVNDINDYKVYILESEKEAEDFMKKNQEYHMEEISDSFNVSFSNSNKNKKDYKLLMALVESGGCGPFDFVEDLLFNVSMTKSEYDRLKRSLPCMINYRDKSDTLLNKLFGENSLCQVISDEMERPYFNRFIFNLE